MTTTGVLSTSIGVEWANRRCAEVTRAAAANFYYGIRLLPQEKRAAMCAIYALARRIDDIGDSGLPRAQSIRLLDEQRDALLALEGDGRSAGADPVLVALAHAHARFDVPLRSLIDLIEGVRMDVLGASFEDFDELVLYCRRVAGSIGRLSLAIFGARDRVAAGQLADDLGVAMQLTNILRDVREDAERGRIYLPREDLLRYHLHDDGAVDSQQLLALAGAAGRAPASVVDGFGGGDVGQLFALMRWQALRAHEWFARGLSLLPLLDRRSAACVSAMSGIYRRVLREIEREPDAALRARVSLPIQAKARIALGSMLAPQRP
ncbi:MAG: phytoene/squalene synthase family protein, partial [Solirubrobacteraceae bacterium]